MGKKGILHRNIFIENASTKPQKIIGFVQTISNSMYLKIKR